MRIDPRVPLVVATLVGCGAVRDTPNTVTGLQVVAIETTPAEPSALERLQIRAWVADARPDRAADTLIWMCTPVDGRCVEATALEPGLPLSMWASAGRAAPTFDIETPWPLFASIAASQVELPEDVRGNLLVWALACAPGVCPVIDQVAADPVAGSEAWHQAVDALSDPSRWIDSLPRDQVSVAVKVVPVDLGGSPLGSGDRPTTTGSFAVPPDTRTSGAPNRAPSISRSTAYPDGDVKVLQYGDPDGDELLTRAFVTAGGVTTSQREGELWVMHQPPVVPDREGVLFVVVEDQRGGTAVWTDHPAFDPCSDTGVAEVALQDGAPLPMRTQNGVYRVDVPWSLRTTAPTAEWTVSVEVGGERWESGSPGLQPIDVERCTFEQLDPLRVPGVADDVTACAALGRIATIELHGTAYHGAAREEFSDVVRGVLVPGNEAFERFCRAL